MRRIKMQYLTQIISHKRQAMSTEKSGTQSFAEKFCDQLKEAKVRLWKVLKENGSQLKMTQNCC